MRQLAIGALVLGAAAVTATMWLQRGAGEHDPEGCTGQARADSLRALQERVVAVVPGQVESLEEATGTGGPPRGSS